MRIPKLIIQPHLLHETSSAWIFKKRSWQGASDVLQILKLTGEAEISGFEPFSIIWRWAYFDSRLGSDLEDSHWGRTVAVTTDVLLDVVVSYLCWARSHAAPGMNNSPISIIVCKTYLTEVIQEGKSMLATPWYQLIVGELLWARMFRYASISTATTEAPKCVTVHYDHLVAWLSPSTCHRNDTGRERCGSYMHPPRSCIMSVKQTMSQTWILINITKFKGIGVVGLKETNSCSQDLIIWLTSLDSGH